jgi:hypothetical protein
VGFFVERQKKLKTGSVHFRCQHEEDGESTGSSIHPPYRSPASITERHGGTAGQRKLEPCANEMGTSSKGRSNDDDCDHAGVTMPIALHEPRRTTPEASALGDLVNLLKQHYVAGDALEPARARRIVSDIIYDMLTNAYDPYVRTFVDADMAELVRPWDAHEIFPAIMGVTIRSHRRSREAVADGIVYRSLTFSRNQIFLDTSEIAPLLAVACTVGLEIERVIPETAQAWVEESN